MVFICECLADASKTGIASLRDGPHTGGFLLPAHSEHSAGAANPTALIFKDMAECSLSQGHHSIANVEPDGRTKSQKAFVTPGPTNHLETHNGEAMATIWLS